jgi:hypothetical protein
MHPEVLQLIVDKLTDLVQKDLGYPVHFEWPKEPQEQGRKMTMVVVTERQLNRDERQNQRRTFSAFQDATGTPRGGQVER